MKKVKALTKSIFKVSIVPVVKFTLEIIGIIVSISLLYYLLEYKAFILLFGIFIVAFFGFGLYLIVRNAVEDIIDDYREQMGRIVEEKYDHNDLG